MSVAADLAADEIWMQAALAEALLCLRVPSNSDRLIHDPSNPDPSNPAETQDRCSDVPVGAVCVYGGEIVGRGHNRREIDLDPTAHAEMLALRAAAAHGQCRHLHGTTLYVTLEPCAMCAGAIVLSRIDRVVFGAFDPKAGACGSVFDIARDARLNHRVEVTGGVLQEPCAQLLRHFFAARRRTAAAA